MKLETFEKIIAKQKKLSDNIRAAYKLKIDIIDFVDGYSEIATILITEIYGKEGYDWYSWYCYEMNYGSKGISAWDENGAPICYDVKSLWEFLEQLKAK
jgi:signal peptidase I